MRETPSLNASRIKSEVRKVESIYNKLSTTKVFILVLFNITVFPNSTTC